MARWQQGRFITDWADQAEVSKLLELMPVQAMDGLPVGEQIDRRVALYNLFGIGAVAHDGGIQYEPGVELQDQPLLAALDVLFARRFPARSSEN